MEVLLMEVIIYQNLLSSMLYHFILVYRIVLRIACIIEK